MDGGRKGPRFTYHRATASGAGGIAIIELHGDGAAAAIAGIFRPAGGGPIPVDGDVRLGALVDGTGRAIDEVLLAAVPAGASWCGLPGWAISSHGGATVAARIRAALEEAGGEERDRAGMVALARSLGAVGSIEGEALVLLPGALTVRAARYLARMAAGELSAALLRILGDLDRGDPAAARAALDAMRAAAAVVRRLLVPRRILIAGRPNVGKSSLFNRLVERERAAVAPVAGTTRDLIEETLAIDGWPVVLIDGAGLRTDVPADPVEREGIRRARAAATDCVLFLADRPGPLAADEEAFIAAIPPGKVLVVRTKADLLPPGGEGSGGSGGGEPGLREAGGISARTGAGIEGLRRRIREEWLGPAEGDELPAAPFTEAGIEAVVAAAGAPSVDAAREALVKSYPDPRRGPTPRGSR